MKDFEWAKKKIKEIHTLTFDSYEAAVIANNKHFQMKNSEQLALINKIMEILDQLDEPETLSKKWIENHTASAYTIAHYSEEDVPVIMVSDLKGSLIANEPNPPNSMGLELPMIPIYVAEWIEKSKENKSELGEGFSGVFTALDLATNPTKDLFWIKDNQELFARAWLDGYTVEEKKYKVFIGEAYEGRGLFLSKSPYDGTVTIGTNLDYFRNRENNKETHLTEKEIKDYDERYWAFAVPVEELEE